MDKIKNLKKEGLISENEYEVIDKLREIGNLSTHKLKRPSSSDLVAALEATNHLLRTIYVVPKRTRRLREKKGDK